MHLNNDYFSFYPCCQFINMCWLGCKLKAICPHVGSGPIGGLPSVRGLSKGSQPVLMQISQKTSENFEQLGRQARQGFEPGTSRLPALNAIPLRHWCGLLICDNFTIYYLTLFCNFLFQNVIIRNLRIKIVPVLNFSYNALHSKMHFAINTYIFFKALSSLMFSRQQ